MKTENLKWVGLLEPEPHEQSDLPLVLCYRSSNDLVSPRISISSSVLSLSSNSALLLKETLLITVDAVACMIHAMALQ